MIGPSLSLTSAQGGAAFDPKSITGLVLDLWASDGVTLAGSKVSAVADRSASGFNASQGTDANRPTFNATGINSRPTFDFGASTNLDGSMNLTAGDWTVFVVYSPDGAAGTNQSLYDWQGGRLILMHMTSTSGQTGYFDGATFKNVGAAATGAQVLTYRLNATGGNSASVRRNGTALATGLSYTQKALGGLGGAQKIGADYLGSSQFLGKLGRLVIYSGNKTDAECATVERGLGKYYSITVA